jgi:hypothetical protein
MELCDFQGLHGFCMRCGGRVWAMQVNTDLPSIELCNRICPFVWRMLIRTLQQSPSTDQPVAALQPLVPTGRPPSVGSKDAEHLYQ